MPAKSSTVSCQDEADDAHDSASVNTVANETHSGSIGSHVPASVLQHNWESRGLEATGSYVQPCPSLLLHTSFHIFESHNIRQLLQFPASLVVVLWRWTKCGCIWYVFAWLQRKDDTHISRSVVKGLSLRQTTDHRDVVSICANTSTLSHACVLQWISGFRTQDVMDDHGLWCAASLLSQAAWYITSSQMVYLPHSGLSFVARLDRGASSRQVGMRTRLAQNALPREACRHAEVR